MSELPRAARLLAALEEERDDIQGLIDEVDGMINNRDVQNLATVESRLEALESFMSDFDRWARSEGLPREKCPQLADYLS